MGTDIHGKLQIKADGEWQDVAIPYDLLWRDYDSFAVLADVRNGYGFAGVTTGDVWPTVIPERRGLPGSITRLGDGEWYKSYGDHSFNHLYLDEMEKFWDSLEGATYTTYKTVDHETYIEYLAGVPISSWCNQITGIGIKVVDEEVYVDGDDTVTHVRVADKGDARKSLFLYAEVLRFMQEYEDKGVAKKDIRFVFGFDS